MKKVITIIACFAFITLGCKSQSPAISNSVKKKIGVQLYSVRDDINKDFKGTVAAVGKAGFTYAEAAGYNNGKFYGYTPIEFKNILQSYGLTPLSSHTGKGLAENISQTNWNEVWSWWDQTIAAHKAAGMKYIVTPWMGVPKTLADLQAYCDYYNKIGEKCNKAGLKFGYHNHAHEFQTVEGKTMYDYLLQHTDPSKVFYEMDVYWTTKGGKNPVDYFNKYPGRFTLLHIKDEKELGGDETMVNFDNIFKNAAKAGLKYPIVEVERYSFAPLESVQKSIQYLLDNKNVKNTYAK